MSDDEDSIMIAILPAHGDWGDVEFPHLTLVYAGLVADAEPDLFNKMLADTIMLAVLMPPPRLMSFGFSKFGTALESVEVLQFLASPALTAARRMVEKYSKSEYKTFRPHVTVGSGINRIERDPVVSFNQIVLAWGSDRHSFPFNGF